MPQLADFSLQSLECFDWDMFNKSVELSLSFLILILPPSHPDPNLPRNIPDSIAPHKLVQLSIHSDIITLHHFSCELPYFTYCSFGFLLEGYLVYAVFKADGTVDAFLTHLLLLHVLHHFNICFLYFIRYSWLLFIRY